MTRTPQSSSPPPNLRHWEDDQFNRLRLLRSRRVGIMTYRRLMAEHGTAAAALEALPEVAAKAGVTGYTICPKGVIAAELKAGKQVGAQLIEEHHTAYPATLTDLPDAPPFLWALGRVDLLQQPMVAMVGARNASSLGTRMAKRLAGDLGKAGYAVVSGLARGVDAAAHLAALDHGTIAVQAGGVDIMYPAENSALADDIARKGLRLSEMPIGQQPIARHFPARNRIIAGLSQAVVVVEAAAKSGSLITARDALDLGRDVLAVPGHPFDARAAGCNMLIRDGSILVRGIDDILETLAPICTEQPELALEPATEKPLKQVANLHQMILDRLGPSPLPEEQLIRDLDLAAKDAMPALTELELEGAIARDAGGMLMRAFDEDKKGQGENRQKRVH